MSLLFMAAICFLLIPELLKALVFCMVGHSLPVILTMALDILGIFGGFNLLILYIRRKQVEETPGILVCLEGLMPALCAYMLARLVMEFVYPLIALVFFRSIVIGFVLYAAATVLLFIIQGISFYAFVIRCSGRKRTIRSFLRRIYLGLPAVVVVGLASLVGELVYIELPFNNVAVHFLLYLAVSLLLAALLWMALALMGRMVRNAERADSIALEFRAYNTFFTVAALILLFFSVFRTLYNDPVVKVTNTIDTYVYEAEMDMAAADLDSAVEDMNKARLALAVWKDLAGIEENSRLEEAYAENPMDSQLLYLTSLYYGNTDGIEKYLRTYGKEPELSLALLDLYDQQGTATDVVSIKQQKEYRQAAILNCVENGYYTTQWLRPDDIQGKALKLAGELPQYAKYEQMSSVMNLLLKDYQGGSADQEMVNAALTLAEQYPDDWMIQYVAAKAGSELTYDGAEHYEATGQAALRYLDLYILEKEPEAAELHNLKLSVAQMLINCYQYEEALTCLETTLDMDENGNAFILTAQCYNELGMLEECYQTSSEYVKNYPDNGYAMYYGAVSALKLGMYDETLQMASMLASALENCEDEEERIDLDFSLYSLLQYISFNDDSHWTGYQYAFYDQITEEQWQVVNENEFFANYLNAVYNCFKGDPEAALQLVDGILAENDQLPNAWYLKGAILYGIQDVSRFEEAVEAYRKSLAIVPDYATAWYAMANAYDGLEEYELAIEACEHALALLPEQDHGDDWYGISIHCSNLLNALQDKVG